MDKEHRRPTPPPPHKRKHETLWHAMERFQFHLFVEILVLWDIGLRGVAHEPMLLAVIPLYIVARVWTLRAL